jgi:hypothetical protein
MCIGVLSPGLETISTTEYALADTRMQHFSPGLVCSHSLWSSWLVDGIVGFIPDVGTLNLRVPDDCPKART